VTASILTQLGLEDLIASTEEEYIKIATDLANDSSRLSELKRTLRPKCLATICSEEPVTLCREVEAEFRKMWHRLVDQ
jgi:protein O-GlcNAc transferase